MYHIPTAFKYWMVSVSETTQGCSTISNYLGSEVPGASTGPLLPGQLSLDVSKRHVDIPSIFWYMSSNYSLRNWSKSPWNESGGELHPRWLRLELRLHLLLDCSKPFLWVCPQERTSIRSHCLVISAGLCMSFSSNAQSLWYCYRSLAQGLKEDLYYVLVAMFQDPSSRKPWLPLMRLGVCGLA